MPKLRISALPLTLLAILLLADAPQRAFAKSDPSGRPFQALQIRLDRAEAQLAALERLIDPALSECLRVETGPIGGVVGPHVIIEGCNVHIRNGLENTRTTNGLGNLIIGYNEPGNNPPRPPVRSGSHSVVIGQGHDYTSYGGLVAGKQNRVSGANASVVGGNLNTASGEFSAVLGGQFGEASGDRASVVGGVLNTASGSYSVVLGGAENTASSAESIQPW